MECINHNRYFIFLLLTLLTVGCEKVSLPDPVEEVPIFTSKLSLGDQTLDLAAGRENYELATRFNKDDKGVVTFLGILKPKDCRDNNRCPQSLRFAIRDQSIFDPATFRVDQALKVRNYAYSWNHHRDSVQVALVVDDLSPNLSQVPAQWDFGQARVLKQDHRGALLAIDRTQTYRISYTITRGNLLSQQVQTVNLTEGGCRCVIATNGKEISVRAMGEAPFQYQWSTGDTTQTLVRANASVRKFEVTVTDAKGCVSKAALSPSIASVDVTNFSSVSFDIKKQGHVATLDRLQLGQVVIEYIDRNQQTFSSQRFSQPEDSYFNITDVSEFEENAAGQRTKKLQIELSCLLFDASVDNHRPLMGKATIAVAYPD